MSRRRPVDVVDLDALPLGEDAVVFVPPEIAPEAYQEYRDAVATLPGDVPAPIPWCLPIHPAANEYRMLPVGELRDLSQSIRSQGLLEEIELDVDGKVVDGRNRLAASLLGQVRPRFKLWRGDDAHAHVKALNFDRRHMSPDERAALAALDIERFSQAARQRMIPGRRPSELAGDGSSPAEQKALPQRNENGRAVAQVARRHHAGQTKTRDLVAAGKVDARLPVLVSEGVITAKQAMELKALDAAPREKALTRLQAGESAGVVLAPGPLVLSTSTVPRPVEPPRTLRDVVVVRDWYRTALNELVRVAEHLPGPAHAADRARASKLIRATRAAIERLNERLDAAPYLKRACPTCGRAAGQWCSRRTGGYAALHSTRQTDDGSSLAPQDDADQDDEDDQDDADDHDADGWMAIGVRAVREARASGHLANIYRVCAGSDKEMADLIVGEYLNERAKRRAPNPTSAQLAWLRAGISSALSETDDTVEGSR